MRLVFYLILFCSSAFAQFSSTASHIRWGSSLPATCRVTTGDVFFKTSATIGVYYCSATNTWSAAGGGGGSGTVNNCATLGALGYYAATGTAIDCTGSGAVFVLTALATPAAPTVNQTAAGTPGVVGYTYVVVAVNSIGHTAESGNGTTTTGNATLNNTNWNNVVTSCTGLATGTLVDVYRTVTGGTPTTTGKITTSPVACGSTVQDKGLVGNKVDPSGFANTTQGLYLGKTLTVNGLGQFGPAISFDPFNDGHSGFDFSASKFVVTGTLGDSASGQQQFGGVFIMNVDPTVNSGVSMHALDAFINVPATNTVDIRGTYALEVTNTHGGTTQQNQWGATADVETVSVTAHTGTQAAFAGNVGGAVGTIDSMATFWAFTPVTGATIGRNVAYFNENQTGVAGAGKDFSWYSEGGTLHAETGEAGTVGLQILAFASQTADLFQLIASDETTVLSKISAAGAPTFPSYNTMTNCASAASPAVCGSAAAGRIALPTGVTSVALTVNTTAVTANSEIHLFADDTLGAALGVTCNSTLATLAGGMAITARTAGTSFQVTYNGTIATNPLCVSFSIVN